MGLQSWWNGLGRRYDRRNVKLSEPDDWSRHGFGNWAGKSVNPDTALQLSTAWGCVRRIAKTIGSLPAEVFVLNAAGRKERAPDHELEQLLHYSPNADQTAFEFWSAQGSALALWGNSYALKEFSGARLTGLRPLPPDDVVLYRDKNGDPRYKFNDRGKQEDVPEEKIFHSRGFGFGADVGLAPITFARQTLGIGLAIGEAAGSSFARGMRVNGFFTVPQVMKQDQRDQFTKTFIDPMLGTNAKAHYGILEGGTDFKSINIPAKDAEMLMSWKFNVEEICRWFDVPPILVGHASEGQTMWGSGIEQIMLGWLTLNLRPDLKLIEQSIAKRLIPVKDRGRVFVEFNIDALLRADSAARAALYSVYAQNGLRTRNELRAIDNLEPMDGGDDLTVQSNLLPIEMLGKNIGGTADGSSDGDAIKYQTTKAKLDAYGVGVRAGAFTPQKEDESKLREELGLPPASKPVSEVWAGEPVRRPITLKGAEEDVSASAVSTVDDDDAEETSL